MKTRPPYTPCKLYMDFFGGGGLEPGHYLRSNGGSAYLIQTVRPDSKRDELGRPLRPHRRHLGCLRWPPDEIPVDATVHDFTWYKRRKRAHRLSDLPRSKNA